MKLTPYFVFLDELTRLNAVYWNSKYAFQRTAAILGALASVGHDSPDPRVDKVWPAVDPGIRRHVTVKVSALAKQGEQALADMRATSILHACSAFENALVRFFSTALLYQPSAVKSLGVRRGVPAVFVKRHAYESLRDRAVKSAQGIMKGAYSARVAEFTNRFGLTYSATLPTLDTHYEVRHKIAHDQGLDDDNLPDRSPDEIVRRRVSMNESEWKSMLADFSRAIGLLDEALQDGPVVDHGAHLAVHSIFRSGSSSQPLRVGQVRHLLQTGWRLGSITNKDVERICREVGLTVSGTEPVRLRVVRL